MMRRMLSLLPLLWVGQQALAGPLTPPTNLANVIITGGTIAGANASNALIGTRSGGQNTTLANRLGSWCDPVEDYGADPSGSADSAAAINQCLSSGEPTKLPAGNYLLSSGPVVLQTGSVLQGAGIGLTNLRLAAGKNFDVVQSYNADSWVGTNVQQGTNDWAMDDLTIDGNASNQTVTGSARDLANGLTVYGWHWKIYNVLIKNAVGNGMRTDAYQAGPIASPGAEAESHIDRVTIDTVNRHGWWNNAPGLNAANVVVVNASQEADRTYHDFYFTADGSFDGLHAWYRGGGGPRAAYDLYTRGGVRVTNSKFEGAGTGWIYHGGGTSIQAFGDEISNSSFFNNDGAANSGGEVFAGNGNTSNGNQYFCNSPSSGNLNLAGVDIYAVEMGISGGSAVQYNRVSNAQFMGCSDLSPVIMMNSGGFNQISGVSNGVSGGASAVGGTMGNSDSVSITQSNSVLNNTQDFSAGSHITSTANGSVVGGGANHSLGGSYNVIGGGNDNTLSGRNSAIPGGQDANDRGIYGRLCFQSGAHIASVGDHQVCWQTQIGALSAAGTIELLTGSDQSVASVANTLSVPANNLAYGFSCEVNVINIANGDAGQFYIDHALIARGNGAASITINGGSAPIALSHGAMNGSLAGAGIMVTASPDTTIGGLNLSASETGSLSLHFMAMCETREVQ